MSDYYTNLPHNITCIDTGLTRPNMAAFYLVESGDQAAFVETGTLHSVPRAMALLEQKNLSPDQVRYIIPTHVHLDHAGGAGKLMELCPNAELVIHPRGARHMIDPAKLWAGAVGVYGEESVLETYGGLIPIAEERVVIAEDGKTLDLNGRQLEFRDTPGHARHHFCVWDAQSKGWFTGDTFGLAYQELTERGEGFIIPTTTPVQFDPDALISSVELLLSYQPERMFLTHFGLLDNLHGVGEKLIERVRRYRDIAERHRTAGDRVPKIKQGLTDYMVELLEQRGSELDKSRVFETLEMDLQLNAQGLDVWLGQN